jgi:hypothetical protein
MHLLAKIKIEEVQLNELFDENLQAQGGQISALDTYLTK